VTADLFCSPASDLLVLRVYALGLRRQYISGRSKTSRWT